MLKSKTVLWLAVLTVLGVALGCTNEVGKTDQGRVIEYDKNNGTLTIIRDLKADPGKPDYNYLPPLTYSLPKDHADMGLEPKAGYRMKLDTQKKQIVFYDPRIDNFKTIDYKPIDQKDNVDRDDPLVFDKAAGTPKAFPIVDKQLKTITVYSPRQKILLTFSVAAEFHELPNRTWDNGDEVRIHYKEQGKALRVVNLSKNELNKK